MSVELISVLIAVLAVGVALDGAILVASRFPTHPLVTREMGNRIRYRVWR